MHFCSVCDNMYYLKIGEDENKLLYYCRHCGKEDSNLNKDNVIKFFRYQRTSKIYLIVKTCASNVENLVTGKLMLH